MTYVRRFLVFWYDFLVGDAWDIAAGVVVVLTVLGAIAAAQPATTTWLGPLLAAAVIALTWISLQREIRRR